MTVCNHSRFKRKIIRPDGIWCECGQSMGDTLRLGSVVLMVEENKVDISAKKG